MGYSKFSQHSQMSKLSPRDKYLDYLKRAHNLVLETGLSILKQPESSERDLIVSECILAEKGIVDLTHIIGSSNIGGVK